MSGPLPAELSDNIISQLQDDSASLKAVSLTCKQWHDIARPRLNKSVLITLHHPPSVTETSLAVFDIPGYKPKQTTHLTLQSSPHIMLTISSSLGLSLGLPLHRFTNLHTLTLSRLHIVQLLDIPRPDDCTRRITTLRVHRLYSSYPEDSTRLVLAFPSVKCLSIHPIQGTQFREASYKRIGTEISQENLASIKCFTARLDLSPGLPTALLDLLSSRKSVMRLSVVISLATLVEADHLVRLLQFSGIEEMKMWDLGLNWKENGKVDMAGVISCRFQNFKNAHTWSFSLLDFGTIRKHALSYVFIHYAITSLLGNASNVRSFKLAFISPSTSRRDIRLTLNAPAETMPINLQKADILGVTEARAEPSREPTRTSRRGGSSNLWSSERHPRNYGKEHQDDCYQSISSGLDNVWALVDSKLAKSADAFSTLHEVVVEIRYSERAEYLGRWEDLDSGTGNLRDQLDSEMGEEELQELVRSLFPRCVEQDLDVRAKMKLARRISGIWEDHHCVE